MTRTLAGKTILVSGGSRGIGLAIALRAARDGANVVLLAKTATPHPKLEGTIDAVVNNASAIDLSPTAKITMKRYDLLQDVNARGTFALTRAALPYLEAAANPHVLTLSPPLNLSPRWVGAHLAYTLSKYGMSLCTLGFADEFADKEIAANSLWPRTTIGTAAIRNLLGGEAAVRRARTPDIMADAAHAILTRDSRTCTGNFYTDEDVLREEGVTDFSGYRLGDREEDLDLDFFLPDAPLPERP
jgi:citronellol/citronellal dehydrogenase